MSGPALHAKRLRTRSKSFIYLSVFVFSFIFIDFDDMPNDGVGRVAPHGNQRQTRQSLLSARQTHRRQSSPESQTCPLPKLIGLKELEELRHDVPPVSYFTCLFSLILLIFDFKLFSQLGLVTTANSRVAVSTAHGKVGASRATPVCTRSTADVLMRSPLKNVWINLRPPFYQGKTH